MGISRLTSSAATRLVTKANTAGQTALGNATSTGAYGQIVASLSVDYLITHVAIAASTGSTSVPPLISVTVAIGGAGAEAPIATTYLPAIFDPSLNGWTGAETFPVPARVSAGQRIAARFTTVAGSTTGTTSAVIYVFGVPYANLEGN